MSSLLDGAVSLSVSFFGPSGPCTGTVPSPAVQPDLACPSETQAKKYTPTAPLQPSLSSSLPIPHITYPPLQSIFHALETRRAAKIKRLAYCMVSVKTMYNPLSRHNGNALDLVADERADEYKNQQIRYCSQLLQNASHTTGCGARPGLPHPAQQGPWAPAAPWASAAARKEALIAV